MEKMTREQVINAIVLDYIDSIRTDMLMYQDYSFISNILEGEGFTLIRGLDNEQLIVEYYTLFGENICISG